MTEGPVDRLAATVPQWLMFPVLRAGRLLGFAAPAGTTWSNGPLDVTIEPSRTGVTVKETTASRLPAWCPELHLNADRTFCLALNKAEIRTAAAARQWWADLEVHLRLLSVALRTRVWPSHSALDHGDAGAFHQKAMRLAERLGLAEEYARAHAGEPSWIGDDGDDLVGPDGALLGVCRPCGCGDPPVHRFGHCSRRNEIRRLILLERARRLALASFWRSVRGLGRKCCGRIRDCPLAAITPLDEAEGQALARTRRALGSWSRL